MELSQSAEGRYVDKLTDCGVILIHAFHFEKL